MRKSIKNITSFKVMDILERAKEIEREGRNIIHLEVGEPDFPTPEPVVKALKKAVRQGETKYTQSLGIPELRKEISLWYFKNYRVRVNPDNIVVTSGTSPSMLLAFGTLMNEEDEVIMTNPAYSCYPNFVRFFGGKVRWLKISEQESYVPDPVEIKKRVTKKTAAIVVNSPSNPTGSVYPEEVLKDICEIGVNVISDEIYHGLNYESPVQTPLKFSENTFVINGFSKVYAMTGWRLGYLIFPERFRKYIQAMQQNFFISANSFVQRAGISALRQCELYVNKMREEYRKRRDVMREEIIKTGFELDYTPQGAFYFLVNVKKYFKDSLKASFDLLEEAGVAVTPGIDFGSEGEGHLRFSYANSIENIREGFRRIRAYLGKER